MKKYWVAMFVMAGFSAYSQSNQNVGRTPDSSPGVVSESIDEYLGDLPQLQINHANGTFPLDLDALANQTIVRDNVINDDLIVTFSACIGNDCVNGESFGFHTVRLKENNLRIGFDDTSTSASFPANDWEITVNESSNGGANMFAITDVTANQVPFRVDAGAGSNALRIDSQGDVGLGTAAPVVELHVADGDSPTMRLEQNGTSGFTPQTWDVAGNETNFFIRDVTNASRLPFRIRPGAPTSSIDIQNNGDIQFDSDAEFYLASDKFLSLPGTANVHLGKNTGTASTGSHNVLVGESAGQNMTTGSRNLCVGYGSGLVTTTGEDNVNIGQFAGALATTASDNLNLGSRAGYSNVTSIRNVNIGKDAGRFSTSGYNSFVGYRAGYNNTSGTYNTFLGHAAGFSSGTFSNSMGLGNAANPSADNTVVIGNSAITSIGGQVNWTALSDKRFKTDIREDEVKGLEFISKLTPVTYNFDAAAHARYVEDKFGYKDESEYDGKNEIENIRFTGFLAQDVEAAAKDAGYDFSGIDAPKSDNDIYGIRYAEFVVPLVKAVQEQQEQIVELKEEAEAAVDAAVLEEVVAENEALKQALESLTNRLDAIEGDLQHCCMNHQQGSSDHSNSGSNGLGEDVASLEQNQPNPFQENTTIRYYLPSNTERAEMTITDLDGTVLKSFNLSGKGYGQVLISGGSFPSGTYIYSLTVNGERVDSKRMMLL